MASPFAMSIGLPVISSALGMLPEVTWLVRVAVSSPMSDSMVLRSAWFMASNAASVGANNVNGPAPAAMSPWERVGGHHAVEMRGSGGLMVD